ncbi:hypothetical protein FQN54_008380 [Arachnomyces sp. PD_36]|nr:hypothetical protein FQN54_008380 [Arachnomyces sp. PD_36]
MAAFGLATPLFKPEGLRRFEERFVRRQKDNDAADDALGDLEDSLISMEEMCHGYEIDDRDPSRAETLWNELRIGPWFDNWLVSHPDKHLWTYTMDEEVQGNNGESEFGCASVQSECGYPSDCEWHYKQGMGEAYWVLVAASKLHEGYVYLSDQLEASTLYNSIRMSDMEDKFGATPDDDVNPLAIASASFTIASAFAGPLLGPMTIAIGAFGLGAELTPAPPDITATIGEQFSDAFYNAKVQLDETVANIFGGENDMSTEDLPMQTGDYQDAMARFFDGGKFLVQDIQSGMQHVFDEFISVQQKALAGQFIRYMGYVVVVHTNKHSIDECQDLMPMWSTYFQEVTGRCYTVMKAAPEHSPDWPLGIDDGPMSVGINDYGLDFDEFYTNAYDCAAANPEGGAKLSSDASLLPKDGSIPGCFYNVPVVEGETYANGNVAYLWNVGLNTAGLWEKGPCAEPDLCEGEDYLPIGP